MNAIIDTSSLIKKYIKEIGSTKFENLLEQLSEITVSPIYRLEINSAIERRLREKTLDCDHAEWIRKEIGHDFQFFNKVLWNDKLETLSTRLIQDYPIKTLDCIQLASAILSQADIFITSDRKLFHVAEYEMNKVEFV